jgi:DNA (cytosine-5)-methyltransferase 1
MNVIDLFCGAGGFSSGFQRAGFTVKYGIAIGYGSANEKYYENYPFDYEFESAVEATFRANHPDTEFIGADITKLNPEDFLDREIDVIIGSPPCPNFSVAKIDPDPEEGLVLVNAFLKWVRVLKPKFWVMENVEGLKKYLSPSDVPIIAVLNSANYGVPQIRRRLFAGNYKIPPHTHARIPQQTLFGKRLKRWVTVKDAIGDILESYILTDQRGNVTESHTPTYDGSKRPSRVITTIPPREIKNQEAFDNIKEYQYDHANREVEKEEPAPTITTKFRCAQKIEVKKKFKNEIFTEKHPPQELNEPSSTLTSMGLTKPHPKAYVKMKKVYRSLTIREVARLQSFPDDFVFYGSKSSCYSMVGNAVPRWLRIISQKPYQWEIMIRCLNYHALK